MSKIIKVQYFFEKIRKIVMDSRKSIENKEKIIYIKDQNYIQSANILFKNKFLKILQKRLAMRKKKDWELKRISYLNTVKFFSFLRTLTFWRKLRKIKAFHNRYTVKKNLIKARLKDNY